jgi:IQ calmodulin-binding motif
MKVIFQSSASQRALVDDLNLLKKQDATTKPVFNRSNFHRFLQEKCFVGSKNTPTDCPETDSESVTEASSSSSFEDDFPALVAERTRRVTRRTSLKSTNLTRRMLWMEDGNLKNKAVFFKRFNHPAIVIQRHFRGMQQRRVYTEIRRKVQQLEACAAIKIQATTRGFFCRLKLQVDILQQEVGLNQSNLEMELLQIEQQKQLAMDRIFQEVMEEALAEEKKDDMLQQEVLDEMMRLRHAHTKLGEENKILKKAIAMMAVKNHQAILFMRQIHLNIQELEATIRFLEADAERGETFLLEWKHRVEQCETACNEYQCKIQVEQSICQTVQSTIANMLQIAHVYVD